MGMLNGKSDQEGCEALSDALTVEILVLAVEGGVLWENEGWEGEGCIDEDQGCQEKRRVQN